MTHPLLEDLAAQRQAELAARARAHRPDQAVTSPPELRRTTYRSVPFAARLAGLLSRS